MQGGWNHTAHYHDDALALVPRPCRRALDVGCGDGAFTRLIAARAAHVDAIDRDADTALRARDALADLDNVRVVVGDVLHVQFASGAYDYVAALASLHHMPLAPALTRLRGLVAPGGALVVVGLHRMRGVGDTASAALSMPLSFAMRRAFGERAVRAPQRDPTKTLDDIRAAAAIALPGAVVRRRLFWRYTLVWTNLRA